MQSAATPIRRDSPAPLPLPSALGRGWRVTVADYHRLSDAGILAPEQPTELIDGEVVTMPAIGHPHAGTVKLLASLLRDAVGAAAILGVQDPVFLNDHSEPLPDLALLRPRADFYRDGHPGPADVLLLIEVADTSLAYDRDVKLPRYARAGIPEAWLVDLGNRRLLIHRQPGPDGYAELSQPDDLAAVPLPMGVTPAPTVDLSALFR